LDVKRGSHGQGDAGQGGVTSHWCLSFYFFAFSPENIFPEMFRGYRHFMKGLVKGFV